MFGIGWMEMVVIAVVALVVVGPDKLPEMARGLAKFYHGLRATLDETQTAVKTEMALLERDLNQAAELGKIAPPARIPQDRTEGPPQSPGEATAGLKAAAETKSNPEAPKEGTTDERA